MTMSEIKSKKAIATPAAAPTTRLTRRAVLGSLGLASLTGLSSTGCSSSIVENRLFNLVVHGAFILELQDDHLLLRAPAVVGYLYGASCGSLWRAPARGDRWEFSGLKEGNVLRDDYYRQAQREFPQLKEQGSPSGPEHWTIIAPIPTDVRGFRNIRARDGGPVLKGESLLDQSNSTVPSVLVLRFEIAPGRSVELAAASNPDRPKLQSLQPAAGQSMRLYAEPAIGTGGDSLASICDAYQPGLDLHFSAQSFDHGGPYYDPAIRITEADTRHLHEALALDVRTAGDENHSEIPGCLPLGM